MVVVGGRRRPEEVGSFKGEVNTFMEGVVGMGEVVLEEFGVGKIFGGWSWPWGGEGGRTKHMIINYFAYGGYMMLHLLSMMEDVWLGVM